MPLDNSPVTDERATLLQQFVADHDVPCPACNYNLRGLNSSSCPECAQPLVLRVALAEPRWGRFLAALIGLAVGVGFQVLILVFWISISIRRGGAPGGSGMFLYVSLPAAVIGTACLFSLARRRGQFQRASSENQLLLIIGSWVLSLTGFGLFVASAR